MFPAVVSMAGRSLLLQFKQISRGVPIVFFPLLANSWKPIAVINHLNNFQQK
jgi:hypothetical protein